MRILILTNNDVGLYKFRKELIEKLIEDKHKIIISLPYGSFVEELEKIGCAFVNTFIDRRGVNPLKDIQLLINYFKIIKKTKPDIILTYTIKPNIYGGIAARILNIPYMVNITGLGSALEKKGMLKNILFFLYKIIASKANALFYQNEANQKKFKENRITNRNSILLPGSGVNLVSNTFEQYPPNKNIKFLFVGRIMKDKGINELIEAIKILRKTFNHLEFHVVGRCEDGYEKKIEKWSKEGLIIYHGQQDDVHAYMTKCHCLIHPSYHEGLSNVCLEAAATGRPILASRIPGCIETFDEGITGLGFESRNVKSLVVAIIKFIKIPYSEKEKMGILGRKKVEKIFDRKIVIDTYIKEIKNGGNTIEFI